MISQPLLVSALKARREPSGEMRGDKRDRTQMRDLVLVRAVVVHGPDFFVAGAVADEINLRLGDALNAAAQTENNLVGELVRHHARRGVARAIGILLAQDLRRLNILHVVQPALNSQLAAGTPRFPNASMAAFGGGAFHAMKFTSGG